MYFLKICIHKQNCTVDEYKNYNIIQTLQNVKNGNEKH